MWATTQYGVEVAEIEIVQYDTVAGSGPVVDGHEIPQAELVKVSYQYLQPESLRHLRVHLFLKPFLVGHTFEPGQRLKFRYRARSVLWLEMVSPDQVALQELAIKEESIEETITESGSR